MKKVQVLMSSYNGSKYISEQIKSILEQKEVYCDLIIRDDGSTDNTIQIIKTLSELYPSRIRVIAGSNIGYANSFWTLLWNADNNYDYYAFSDQDDVWKSDKLSRACSMLSEEKERFLLYASGMEVVDEQLNHMYYQKFNGLKIGFGSALSRQRLAGCTMVFNNEFLSFVKKNQIKELDGDHLLTHDGFVYYATILLGGKVIFDAYPAILFRRSSSSLTLQGKNIASKIKSVTNVFTTYRNARYEKAIKMENYLNSNIVPKEKKKLDMIIEYKDSIKNTIRLAFSKDIKCGLSGVDLINFVAILLRRY